MKVLFINYSNMLFFKMILFIILVFIFLYFMGKLVSDIFKMKINSIFEAVVNGFCFILALFQIIAYPIQARNGSFYLLLILFVISILLFVIYVLVIKKERKIFLLRRIETKFLGIKSILIFLVIIQSIGSAWFHHIDDDDAYFVSLSSSIMETDVVTSDMVYATTGFKDDISDGRPDTATWEALIAVSSTAFRIHPAILAHTVLPFLLIMIAYMAVYCVAKNFFYKDSECEKKSLYFCIFFCVINIFAGYTVYSTGCFLLLRIWQGKAVLVSIIFPALLANCLYIMNGNHEKKYFVWNSVILIAGICTSVIGVYLLPIYYLVIGIPYLLTINWKNSKKLLFPAFLSLLPVLVYAIAALLTILTQNAGYMNANPPSWILLFKRNMLMGGYYWVLFLISIIYITFCGKRIHRVFFIGSTLCLFLSFLNPFFCRIVAQKITGVGVYWRLYWVVPIYYAISFTAVELLFLIKQNYIKCIWFTLVIIIIGKSGYFMYQAPHFYEHKNLYKLPNEVITIMDTILEDSVDNPCILLPDNLATKARQYSANVKLAVGRYSYRRNNIIEGTEETIGEFYQYLYHKNEYNTKYIEDRLLAMQVNYLVRKDDNINLESEYVHLKTIIDGYQIYYIDIQKKE